MIEYFGQKTYKVVDVEEARRLLNRGAEIVLCDKATKMSFKVDKVEDNLDSYEFYGIEAVRA
ncbi:MAG: hypothetical protein OIF32_02345 [Campylobacterales bacterium]|nr:hypothetical protein [Campylobacterales bacterium]